MIDFDIVTKLIAILFSLLLFGQAYLIKRITGTYIHPAAIFALAWFLYTIIPLVILFKVPINLLSMIFVNMCVLGFAISSSPFNWRHGYRVNALKSYSRHSDFNSFFLNCLLCAASTFSVVFSTVSLASQGFSVSFNLFSLLQASGQFAALSGHNQLISNNWGSVAIFFTYSAAILGGLVYRYKINTLKKVITLLLAFTPAIYFTITQSSKLITFYSVGFFIGAMLLMKINSNRLRIFENVKIFRLFGIALVLLFVVSFSILSRGGGYVGVSGLGDAIERIYATFMNYAFAQLYAFSDFFSFFLGMESGTQYADDYYNYGYYTFKSVFDMFGGTKLFPPTYYYDSYQYHDTLSTNIFTIFRGLIYDFGMIGTIFAMFLIGLIAHSFFYAILVNRNAPISNSSFLVLVVFIQGTYLMSIFTARYSLLIFVVFCCIFLVNDQLSKTHFSITNRVLRKN